MESSFSHPSTHQLFSCQFGLAAPGHQERVEEHLLICSECREADDAVRRNHPAPQSLKLFALDRLHFAQSNVIRLHATKCSWCEQVLASYRTSEQNRLAELSSAETDDLPSTEFFSFLSRACPASNCGEPAGADGNREGEKNPQSIDVAGFFELGGALATCLAMGKRPIESYQSVLRRLKELLGELFPGNSAPRLERAAPSAAQLSMLINKIYDVHGNNMSATLPDEEWLAFREACTTLDRVVSRDLGATDAYCLEAKGGFDPRKLIAGAEDLFGEAYGCLPLQAVHDISQAGTCLALSLATGASFHIVRAAKTVIQDRIETLAGHLPAGYDRNLSGNLSGYVRALLEISDDENGRLWPLLEIRRDPLSDPEVTTTMTEAIVLWATCIDAIRSILDSANSQKSPQIEAHSKLKELEQSA